MCTVVSCPNTQNVTYQRKPNQRTQAPVHTTIITHKTLTKSQNKWFPRNDSCTNLTKQQHTWFARQSLNTNTLKPNTMTTTRPHPHNIWKTLHVLLHETYDRWALPIKIYVYMNIMCIYTHLYCSSSLSNLSHHWNLHLPTNNARPHASTSTHTCRPHDIPHPPQTNTMYIYIYKYIHICTHIHIFIYLYTFRRAPSGPRRLWKRLPGGRPGQWRNKDIHLRGNVQSQISNTIDL